MHVGNARRCQTDDVRMRNARRTWAYNMMHCHALCQRFMNLQFVRKRASQQSVQTKSVISAPIVTCHLFSELAASCSGTTVYSGTTESILVRLEYVVVVSAGVCRILYQRVPTLGVHPSLIILYIDGGGIVWKTGAGRLGHHHLTISHQHTTRNTH